MPYDITASSKWAELVAHLWSCNESLQNAALLLGGRPALQRTQRLLDELTSAPRMTRRLARELRALHDLLTLEHVGDPDRIETELHAAIHPADPVVEDLCLLAEGIEERLRPAERQASLRQVTSLAA